MSDSLKNRLKTEGATRTTRIRDILQTAATQLSAELKEGVSEIRSTANQSFSTAAQTSDAPQTTESSESPSTVFKAVRTRIVNQVSSQLVDLDAKLTTQYGGRYATLKQRFGLFRTWYDNSKAKAEAIGVDPVQQKQAAIELKVAEQGAFVARKEQQIRQQVKQFLAVAISKR